MANLTHVNKISKDNITHIDDIEATNISKIGEVGADFSRVPIGLIVPFNDTNVPSGWERFTSADNRIIVGAGSSYSPGNSGGSTSVSINTSVGTNGNHNLYLNTFPEAYSFGGGVYGSPSFTATAGNHSHTLTSGSYNPLSNNILLIKATTQQSEFPTNAIILGNNSFSGLDNVLTNNYYLRSSSTIGTYGSSSAQVSISAAGSHVHWNTYIWYGGSYSGKYLTVSSGSHGGTASLGVSDYIKKVRLSAWTNASQNFKLSSNMIGMYESLTPPDGWVLCNGSNGTPDLRDYFIQTTSSGNEQSGTGDNTISISTNVSHSATHSHQGSSQTSEESFTTSWHTSYGWTHSHIGTPVNKSFLPPYYALSFIMKSI